MTLGSGALLWHFTSSEVWFLVLIFSAWCWWPRDPCSSRPPAPQRITLSPKIILHLNFSVKGIQSMLYLRENFAQLFIFLGVNHGTKFFVALSSIFRVGWIPSCIHNFLFWGKLSWAPTFLLWQLNVGSRNQFLFSST